MYLNINFHLYFHNLVEYTRLSTALIPVQQQWLFKGFINKVKVRVKATIKQQKYLKQEEEIMF